MGERTTERAGSPASRVSGHSGELLAQAIEAIGFGIVLVTHDGFITFANAMARDLMHRGEGLRASGGWIASTTAELTARLRAFIKSGAKTADGRAGNGATIILERGAGRPSLFVHVMSLGQHRKHAQTAAAVVFIIDPEAYALPSFNAFSALYGLTRAEARVLQQIIGGQGVVAAAATLRISKATARTHLQHIFDKTRTKRQTELLCLFFKATLPAQIASA